MRPKLCIVLCNVFLGQLETTYINPCKQSLVNFQFTNNLFWLHSGNKTKLLGIFANTNTYHPSIKFNYKNSHNSIEFFGTTVLNNKEQNKLLTTVYWTPAYQKNFLHHKSVYKRWVMQGNTHCQNCWIKNICTETSDLAQHLKELKEEFIKCNYQDQLFDRTFEQLSTTEKK